MKLSRREHHRRDPVTPYIQQLRTTCILVLILTFCLGTTLYAHSLKESQTVSTPVSPVADKINAALQKLSSRGAQDIAALQTTAWSPNRVKAELVFVGLCQEKQMKELLSALAEHNLHATFFITGGDISRYRSSLLLAGTDGHSIGVTDGEAISPTGAATSRSIVTELCRTGVAVQQIAGIRPTRALALALPDEERRAAAYACALDAVVVPTRVVPPSQTPQQIEETLQSLSRGSILCVRLDQMEQEPADSFSHLCKALADTDLSRKARRLLAEPYAPAAEQSRVYTTERAAAFTFAGLRNRAEVEGVLSALQEVKGKATFFVTRDDLADSRDLIARILQKGHALGIAVQATRFSSAQALLEELLTIQEELRTSFSYSGDLPVRPLSGGSTLHLEHACGAGSFTLLSAMLYPVKEEDRRSTDAAILLQKYFAKEEVALQRGEIVHFQMHTYLSSDTLLGDLVRLVATRRNIYPLKPVMEILGNSQYTYRYPLDPSTILPEVKDAIRLGQLKGNAMDAIVKRYFGTSWVSTPADLPGFTNEEIRRLDKKGLVPNSQNYIFLTFDDWGTDRTITGLLDVLKAHHAQATFFVRTNYIHNNPNLLRAIALEGHTIASHTRSHFPLANADPSKKFYTELTDAQVKALQSDLLASYQDLQEVVGDISINGRPALSRLFRPPTLAVSKAGLFTVFDCGFTYSVSGSITTPDYKAKDAQTLVNLMKRNTKSGAVFVMHFSDNSVHTAAALDLYLSDMESRSGSQTYQFVSLSEVLR